MIKKWDGTTWEGVGHKIYKDNPGNWQFVTRQNIMEDSEAGFEMRCFQVEIGGYTSFEKHCHEHCVVVLSGIGEVRLANDILPIGPNDAVRVPPMTPHQFRNTGDEPLRFICVVDRVRDRPTLLNADGTVHTSE
jgi:mannose-6-phosphate isomerase-like protein (cupin superfamily)